MSRLLLIALLVTGLFAAFGCTSEDGAEEYGGVAGTSSKAEGEKQGGAAEPMLD